MENSAVIDAASCTNGLLDDVKNYIDDDRRARLEKITLLDSIAWCDQLLPDLTVRQRVSRVAVHPTCSTTHLGLNRTLRRVAEALAEDVLVPVGTTCCGTAGDRDYCTRNWSSPPSGRRAVLDAAPAGRLPVRQPNLRDGHASGYRAALRVVRLPARGTHPPCHMIGAIIASMRCGPGSA